MSAMNYLQPAKQPTQAGGSQSSPSGYELWAMLLDELLSNVGRCQSNARRGHKSRMGQRMSKRQSGARGQTMHSEAISFVHFKVIVVPAAQL